MTEMKDRIQDLKAMAESCRTLTNLMLVEWDESNAIATAIRKGTP